MLRVTSVRAEPSLGVGDIGAEGGEAVYARRQRSSRIAEIPALPAMMSAHLDSARPRTDAEALQLLRRAFPTAPLAMRVAALAARPR